MTEKEVKEKIGEDNWDSFCKWMVGQTVGVVNGEYDYYDCDVEAFMDKLYTGYDRQKSKHAFD